MTNKTENLKSKNIYDLKNLLFRAVCENNTRFENEVKKAIKLQLQIINTKYKNKTKQKSF